MSCASASACAGVGNYANSTGTLVTLAERWNGASWLIQSTPNPAGQTGDVLSGVSCTSATWCTAVGSWPNSSGHYATLALRYS